MSNTNGKDSSVERDAVDEAIDRIEQSLPALRRVGRANKKQKRSTVDRLSPGSAKHLRKKIEALLEDPLLSEIRDDNGAVTEAASHRHSDNGIRP